MDRTSGRGDVCLVPLSCKLPMFGRSPIELVLDETPLRGVSEANVTEFAGVLMRDMLNDARL